MTQLVKKARLFGIRAHEGQTYGEEFPYRVHLQAVESVMLRFGLMDEVLRAAGWLHDTLEDTNRTYEELVTFFGLAVADLVSAVTEPKGGNRAWRHSQTYPKIAGNVLATRLKLCDRIANVEAGGKKSIMYVKEHVQFKNALWFEGDGNEALWVHLDSLIINQL